MYSSIYFNRFTSQIHCWEYNEEGKKQEIVEPAPLYFYMKGDGEYTSIYGDKLKKVEFETFGKLKEARDMYKSAGRELFESDVDIENRYILDKYSNKEVKIPNLDIHFIDIEVHSEVGFPKPDAAEHPVTIITVYSTKHKKFFVFAEKNFDTSFLPEGTWVKCFNGDEKELLKTYIGFVNKTQPDIISGWNSDGFDIPYIINRCEKLLGKDITKKLSPVRSVKKVRQRLRFGKEREIYEIGGINLIDYLDLYKKYHQGEQESFKLDYIARIELGESKLEFEGSLKDLYHNNWQKYVEYNFQDTNLLKKLDERIKFMNLMIGICYNCKVPFDQFSKTTKVLDGAFISSLIKEKVILPNVKHDENQEQDQYVGAFVCDPDVGLHEWVISFDATSLYPSIMIQHNISPETKVMVIDEVSATKIMNHFIGDDLSEADLETYADGVHTIREVIDFIKKNGHTLAANGSIYRHDKQGVVARFVKDWFEKRQHHKKLMKIAEKEGNEAERQFQSGMEQNYKILINSVYGYVGSKYSRLYDKDNAVAVTLTGQAVIKSAMSAVDTFFNSKWQDTEIGKKLNAKNVAKNEAITIYGDTDSCYLAAGRILKSFNYQYMNDIEKCFNFVSNNIEKILSKLISNEMEILTIKKMNCKDCKIIFKREMIAHRVFFVAKKRYVGTVLDLEGKRMKLGDKGSVKAKGIEMVKSSTPEWARDKMKEFLLVILKDVDNKAADQKFKEIRTDYYQRPVENIAKITNVNNISDYTGQDGMPIKGAPGHVKGAIGYNFMRSQKNLEDAIEEIYEGDKVKVVNIKDNPNYQFDSIAIKGKLPKEFGLEKFVDYDMMWNKVFVEPMRNFYDIMKWELPNFEQEDIMDLFE